MFIDFIGIIDDYYEVNYISKENIPTIEISYKDCSLSSTN
jgi:hypothetical protein